MMSAWSATILLLLTSLFSILYSEPSDSDLPDSEPSDDAVDRNMGDNDKEYGVDMYDQFIDAMQLWSG